MVAEIQGKVSDHFVCVLSGDHIVKPTVTVAVYCVQPTCLQKDHSFIDLKASKKQNKFIYSEGRLLKPLSGPEPL